MAVVQWGAAEYHLVPNAVYLVYEPFGTRCHQYADDIHPYFIVTSELEEAVQVLNQCLDLVVEWMRANELSLISSKKDVL